MSNIRILTILFALATVASAQWPIVTTPGGDGQVFKALAMYDATIIVQNQTGGLIIMLDCYLTNSDIPCTVEYTFTVPNVPTLGTAATFNGDALLVSDGSGNIHFIDCDGPFCSYYYSIPIAAGSPPKSIIYDDLNTDTFYVAYPSYDGGDPVVLQISYNDTLDTFNITSTLNNFREDCILLDPEDFCFIGPIGRDIAITASHDLLFVSFPLANNGRGLILMYNCTSECVIQNMLYNPYEFPYAGNQVGEGYGTSISSFTINDTYINVVVGVPRATLAFDGVDLTNLYTGGAYAFYCDPNNEAPCSKYQTLTLSSYFSGSCDLINQNYGLYSYAFEDGIFVSSPGLCNGKGAVFFNSCTVGACTYSSTITDFTPELADLYGTGLIVNSYFVLAGAKGGPYISFSPYSLIYKNSTKIS